MKMRARLFCRTGPLAGSSFAFEEEAIIGKDPGNSIQLTAGVISGKHARIYFDRQRKAFFVEDLESRNGTWVDGVRILHKERLDRLNVISFAGSFDFIFQVVEAVANKEEAAAPQMENARKNVAPGGGTVFDSEPIVFPGVPIINARSVPAESARVEPIPSPPAKPESEGAPVAGMATQVDDQGETPPAIPSQQLESEKKRPSRKVYALEIQLPKGGPQLFTLKEGENVVGRDGSCDITVSDSSISRRHAVITVGPESVTARDLASKNHTFVDNKVIEAEIRLVHGSEIRFGSVQARLTEKS